MSSEPYWPTFQKLLAVFHITYWLKNWTHMVLNAYGLDNKPVKFVYDYLTSRKQRTKISDTYSWWQEILLGVSQGSILRPLLFNIDICHLFFMIEDCDVANHADKNTPYFSGKNVEEVMVKKMCRQTCFNGFLKMDWKEMQANIIYW